MKSRALLIAGPTASGKSALAATLAHKYGGMIINADSMQIYRDLSVLTARPTPDDEARFPHRLYGIMGHDEVCSAARWVSLARGAMDEAWAQNLLPIIVGGTGLYLRALTDGLADIPEIPEEIRSGARSLMAHLGPSKFHAELLARHPQAVQGIRPTDSQRLVRALEVYEATGHPLTYWHAKETSTAENNATCWTRVALMPDRQHLHQAINRRFATMMANGALDEARAIARLGLNPGLPLSKVLGLRPLMAHLAGEMTLNEAVAQAQTDTRRYAKRQCTWIRTQMIAWNVIFEQDSERIIDKIGTLLSDLR